MKSNSGTGSERRLAELFQLACELPAEELEGFVVRHCADDAELAERLHELLQQDREGTQEFLKQGIWAVSKTDDERVGPYKLIKLLGEGGMGTVHLAEQEEPIRRLVALKRIRLGLFSDNLARRFDAERDALGRMEHPGIATIFDAGVTDTGIPYFVMEYVPGPTLTAYCEEKDLSLEQRLKLFIGVCDAVQHAHQKGIVHSDLKPSNVLVRELEGVPLVKVIDFGVSRAISGSLKGDASLTQGGMMGTLTYMSPEQADDSTGAIDTRTDVYSLGVMLYRLVTGKLPFEQERFESIGRDEAVRVLCHEAPPRPSKCANSTTGFRLTSEIDSIVGKALEKDRAKRYSSVSELGADVRRLLAFEPLTAGPPSATYRIGRFAHRHPVALGLCSLLFLSLVAGIYGSTRGMQRARVAEAEVATHLANAQLQRSKASAISTFLNRGLLLIGDERLSAVEILDRSRPQVDLLFSEHPAERAAVRTALGRAYLSHGADRRAQDQFREALSIIDSLGDVPIIDQFLASSGLLEATRRVDGIDASKPYADQTYELARRYLGADDQSLAASLDAIASEDFGAASIRPLFDVIENFPSRAMHDDDTFMLGRSLMEVGVQLVLSDSEWAPMYIASLESKARELIGPEDVRLLNFLWFETNLWLMPGREFPSKAMELSTELHSLAQQFLPEGDWLRLDSRRLLGLARGATGELEAAEEILLSVESALDNMGGGYSDYRQQTSQGLAQLIQLIDRQGELESFLPASLERWKVARGGTVWWPLLQESPSHAMTQFMEHSLGERLDPEQRGMLLVRQGRNGEAVKALADVTAPEGQLFRLISLARLGRREEAQQALQALRPALGSKHRVLLAQVEAEL